MNILKCIYVSIALTFCILSKTQLCSAITGDITREQRIGSIIKSLVDEFIKSTEASLETLPKSEQAELKQIMTILKNTDWILAFKLYQQHVRQYQRPIIPVSSYLVPLTNTTQSFNDQVSQEATELRDH